MKLVALCDWFSAAAHCPDKKFCPPENELGKQKHLAKTFFTSSIKTQGNAHVHFKAPSLTWND